VRIAGDAWLKAARWNNHGLLRKLPDGGDDAQKEENVENSFKKTALLIFRPNEESISGFVSCIHRGDFGCAHHLYAATVPPSKFEW
jgi:hypothetical protein